MPWKIVNLDYDCQRPHLHMRDPGNPIHMRTYFGSGEVEIGIGAEHPEECPVRVSVTADDVVSKVTRFQRQHILILKSILMNLDVEGKDLDRSLSWMCRTMVEGPPQEGWYRGNITAHPAPQGWPYDLTDAALIDTLKESIRPSRRVSESRLEAIQDEVLRRGLEDHLQNYG